MRIRKITKREYQKKYIENCLPIEAKNVNTHIENDLIIVNFNGIRLISSSIEEMREKIKVALNK
jgi:hypothetical protein